MTSTPLTHLTRRGFLKRLGATAVFTAAAPLLVPELAKAIPTLTQPTAPIYIPAPHLDYVPRKIETDLRSLPLGSMTPDEFQYGSSVKVLMLQDTWYAPLGGPLRSGAEIRVPVSTAGRWLDYGIAVPAPGQPEVTPNTARRSFEAAQRDPSSATVNAINYDPNYLENLRNRMYQEEALWKMSNPRLVRPTNPNVEQEYLSFVERSPIHNEDAFTEGFATHIQRTAAMIKRKRDDARKNSRYEEYIEFANTQPVSGNDDEDTA